MRKLCFAIANFIYKNGDFTHEDRYVIYYTLKLMMSQLFVMGFILLVSIPLGIFFKSTTLLMGLVIIRAMFNGFHATTYNSCKVLSTIIIMGLSYIQYSSLTAFISGILLGLFISTKVGIKVFTKIEFIYLKTIGRR